MRKRNNYSHGDNNVIDDFTGFKEKRSECRLTWDGRLTKHWEPRHPQDFVRARGDKQTVDIARPENTDSFLTTNEVTADDL